MPAPAVEAAPSAVVRDGLLRALVLGREVAGTTAPNPPVGCVLVRDGMVVGEGATAPVGGPHAEVRALAAAGARAAGATALVTLEPCAHTGRTGPCTEALRAAGVVAVRYLVPDPDPVAAGGAAALVAAGLDVADAGAVLPDLAASARHDLRGFLMRVARGRPHVVLKLAQDATGRTQPPPGGYLTGVEARTRVHALRADVDAVLVGGATVRADDPRLDVRHVPARRQPRPVVLSVRGDVPTTARVVGRGAIVVVGPGAPAPHRRALADAGAEVLVVPHAPGPSGGLDLPAALAALPSLGILTVLAEPGPALAAALLASDLADAVEVHVAGAAGAGPGGASVAPVLDLPSSRLVADAALALGPDRVLRFVRRARPVSPPRAVA